MPHQKPRNPPPDAASETQWPHFSSLLLREQLEGSKTPSTAPPVGRTYAVTPDGHIVPPSKYRPSLDILVIGEA